MQDNIESQYNTFHDVYSTQLAEQDQLSNTLFYMALEANLEGKVLLDIGCGDGEALKILKSKGASICGLDPSIKFLEKAKQTNPEGIFVQGVGESLPFSDESFDVVISKWALQTSKDVPGVLRESARVLKTGGMLVFLTKHPMQQWMEKIRDYGNGANYYEQKIVTSNIYAGTIELKEPSHTLGEYLNKDFFQNFEVIEYTEQSQFPASEQFDGNIYPTFMLIKAIKK